MTVIRLVLFHIYVPNPEVRLLQVVQTLGEEELLELKSFFITHEGFHTLLLGIHNHDGLAGRQPNGYAFLETKAC